MDETMLDDDALLDDGAVLDAEAVPFDTSPRDSRRRAGADDDRLQVAVGGFEGPLDLLLTLARTQKVDLARISVLELAEQYLAFVDRARNLRIELAADYLVMAAWLAFLKSRLLLPKPEDDGPSGEEMAARLAFQLERLAAMRRVAAQLMARDQLDRDFFRRGAAETLTVNREVTWSASLSDLLKAYGSVRMRGETAPFSLPTPRVLTVEAALERMRGLIGTGMSWSDLVSFLPDGWALEPAHRRSAIASTFSAMLELAKLGEVEIRQETTFAPIVLRKRRTEEACG